MYKICFLRSKAPQGYAFKYFFIKRRSLAKAFFPIASEALPFKYLIFSHGCKSELSCNKPRKARIPLTREAFSLLVAIIFIIKINSCCWTNCHVNNLFF